MATSMPLSLSSVRAEQIGSLLRPQALLEARQAKQSGELSDAAPDCPCVSYIALRAKQPAPQRPVHQPPLVRIVAHARVLHLPSPYHRLRFARSAHNLGRAAAVGRGEDDVGARFCGALRSNTIASSRWRSARVTFTTIPALMSRA